MNTRQLERWEQVTAEIEIRRWLIAHDLWAPEAEKLVLTAGDGQSTDQVAPEPGATLEAMLLVWPTLRRRIEAQFAEHVQQDSDWFGPHDATIREFEAALRRLVNVVAQLQHDREQP